jgi:hypothetical protein
MTITVERNHAGAYVLSAIVGGYLVTRQYYGYTKRDAVALFRRDTA